MKPRKFENKICNSWKAFSNNKFSTRSNKLKSWGDNRRLTRKSHRGYKTWKKWLKGNKKARKSESGRKKYKLPDKK